MDYDEWKKDVRYFYHKELFGGKWKLSIIWFFNQYGTMRYSRLKGAFEDSRLTQKMLTQHVPVMNVMKIRVSSLLNNVIYKLQRILLNKRNQIFIL